MNEQNNYNVKKDKDIRNIMLTFLGVFIILAAVASGTFAYYTFSATNTGTVRGSAASTSGLSMTVTKVAPTTTSAVLVPQLDQYLNSALIGTGDDKCIDGNGNTVCLVYRVNISNTTGSNFLYDLKIKFNNASSSMFTNLKYAFLPTESFEATDASSITYGASAIATPSSTSLQDIITGQSIAVSGSAIHYFVVWLGETNSEQKSTDYGSFTGTVSLTDNAGNQYLTSTFTS